MRVNPLRLALLALCLSACAPKPTQTVSSHTWNLCGGLVGHPCASTETCVDDPRDNCDPQHGGSDCSGFCVPTNATTCGGVAGKACPSGQTCADDPSDTCDPDSGGADCSGLCISP